MHDAASLERKGVPSVALLSDAFLVQARYQARSLGVESLASLLVQHPISDATPAEMVAKADAVFPDVVRALTSDDIPRPAGWSGDAADPFAIAAEPAGGDCVT